MIKAVIIDDELPLREAIRNKLNTYFDQEILVIGEAGNVKNGVKLINNLKPDLLLLDIELSDGTSFDLLEQINIANYKIIFITGFNEHAIKAIKLGAIDYLLKPIDDNEFKESIKKVINIVNPQLNEQVKISSTYYKLNKNNRIVLKTLEAYFIIDKKDILYCKSEGNYTTFFIKGQKEIMISKPLKKAIELIADDHFIRCHQSYLVNLNHIDKYLPDGYLIIKNAKIPVASRRKEMIINKLTNL